MATWSRITLDRLRSAWKGVEVARWLVEATCSMFGLFTDMFANAVRSGVLGEGKGNVGAALLIGELCRAPLPFLLFPPPGVDDVEVWREAGREDDLVKGGGVGVQAESGGGVGVREEGKLSGWRGLASMC